MVEPGRGPGGPGGGPAVCAAPGGPAAAPGAGLGLSTLLPCCLALAKGLG